jgi:hypothetical protein
MSIRRLHEVSHRLQLIAADDDGFACFFRGKALIVSWGGGWEHVSVSHFAAVPDWRDMCEVKDLMWPPEDWVMQYHPARSEYVNYHPYCLHLWRPVDGVFPTPPSWMVGPKVTP